MPVCSSTEKAAVSKGPGCAPFQLCLWLVAVRPHASQDLPRADLPYHTREQPRNGKRERTVGEKSTKENVYSVRHQYLSAQRVHIQEALVLGQVLPEKDGGSWVCNALTVVRVGSVGCAISSLPLPAHIWVPRLLRNLVQGNRSALLCT